MLQIKTMEAADNSDTDNNEESVGNAAWADCMMKILSATKPASQRFIPLSRAKKYDPEKEGQTKECDFEITPGPPKDEEATTGEVVSSKSKKSAENKSASSQQQETKPKKKNLKLELRLKPTWKDIERERALRKVATKGVVQLFNAVRSQQRDLEEKLEEAGPLDSRRSKVLNNVDKKQFLNYLMSGKRSQSEYIDNPVKKEEPEDDDDDKAPRKSEWSVLDDNFLTSKENNYWDLEDEDEEGDNEEGQMESDSMDSDSD